MARKQKRRQRDRRRPVQAPAAPAASQAPPPASGASRPVEMKLASPVVSRRRVGRVVLDSTDPAIPLDQVPHFTGDLKRIGITMAAMVVLLIIGSFFIPFAAR